MRPGADGVDGWVGTSQRRDAVMEAREGRPVRKPILGWRGSLWRTVTVGRDSRGTVTVGRWGRGTVTVGRGGRGTMNMGRGTLGTGDMITVWRNWPTKGLLPTRTQYLCVLLG